MLDAGLCAAAIYDWGMRDRPRGQRGAARRPARRAPVAAAAAAGRGAGAAAAARQARPHAHAHGRLCGGSAMAPDVFRLFHAMGVPLRNIYGCHRDRPADRATRASATTSKPSAHWMKSMPGSARRWSGSVTDEGELLVRGGSPASSATTASRTRPPSARATAGTAPATRCGDRARRTGLPRAASRTCASCAPAHRLPAAVHRDPAALQSVHQGRDDAGRRDARLRRRADQHRHAAWSRAGPRSAASASRPSPTCRSSRRCATCSRGEIRAQSTASCPTHARVVRFANFPKELDPDEGELTRSRKLRREFLRGALRSADRRRCTRAAARSQVEIPVTYQDGRRTRLRSRIRARSGKVPSRP